MGLTVFAYMTCEYPGYACAQAACVVDVAAQVLPG